MLKKRKEWVSMKISLIKTINFSKIYLRKTKSLCSWISKSPNFRIDSNIIMEDLLQWELKLQVIYCICLKFMKEMEALWINSDNHLMISKEWTTLIAKVSHLNLFSLLWDHWIWQWIMHHSLFCLLEKNHKLRITETEKVSN